MARLSEYTQYDNLRRLINKAIEEMDDQFIGADEWFNSLDFQEMERMSGIKRANFPEDDGNQDFVDAVTAWWNGFNEDEKADFKRDWEYKPITICISPDLSEVYATYVDWWEDERLADIIGTDWHIETAESIDDTDEIAKLYFDLR